MSEVSPEATVAGEAAAAAVEEVQAREAVNEAAGHAEVNAAIAEETAGYAAETASEAAQTSVVAVETAAIAHDTAQQAADVAISVAMDNESLHGRLTEVEQKQESFFAEARGFFARIEEKDRDTDAVTHVEVTHNADPAASGTDTGSQGTPSESGSRRHRFGRLW